jgi:DNA-binding transcriptional MerR regulator/methylmalonyl-CoA mutase cobalamin-binding subunit
MFCPRQLLDINAPAAYDVRHDHRCCDGAVMSPRHEPPAMYPIRVVSRLTGVGIDTLRAWERRHGVVTPKRDDRGRLYTDADIARLRLVHAAVAAGHAVGRVASLSDDGLRRLTSEKGTGDVAAPHATRTPLDTTRLDAALRRFDGAAVDAEISRLATVLPPIALVRDALLPVIRDVGEAWNRERGGIAREHLVSNTARNLLGSFLRLHADRDAAVRLLFATPSGERHELGILVAAMLAASSGLGVTYLGPDLPAHEIVEAAEASGAQVLVLGLTRRGSAGPALRELRLIARALPPRIAIWAGGPAAGHLGSALGARGLVVQDFDAYLEQVARLGGRAS